MIKNNTNMEQKIPTDFLTSVLTKWGDKMWFKVLFIFAIIQILIGPIVTPIITNYVQKEQMSATLTTTLDTREQDVSNQHKVNFEYSRQAYALAKRTMTEYLSQTGAEYIFLIEFHNGSENVMTGIQFCRFDMTLEVAAENVHYVPVEKFKDDIIARYDILLSEELGKNRVLYFNENDFEKVDKYLAYQMQYVNAKSYAIVSLKDKNNKIFGALLCVSSDTNALNLLKVRELGIELEDIFVPNSPRNIAKAE